MSCLFFICCGGTSGQLNSCLHFEAEQSKAVAELLKRYFENEHR